MRNVIIGIIVILALIISVIGYNYLSGKDFFGIFGTKNIFYVKYNHVNGLSTSSYVTLRGYNIGKVMDIAFSDNMANELIVSFTLEKRYKIPKNSIARIVSTDLMGTRAINILPPTEILYPQSFLEPRDTLKGSVEGGLKEQVNEQIRPLKAKTENLLSSIDSMVNIIKLILNEQNQKRLTKSIYNIQQTMEHLTATTRQMENLISKEQYHLEKIIDNTYQTTNTIKENNENLQKIFTNFSTVSENLVAADLGTTLLKTKRVIDQTSTLLEKINQGEGTIGALMQDDKLYNDLSTTSVHLERLLSDFRRNPKKYINLSLIDFGKQKHYDEHGNRISKKERKLNTWYRIQILYATQLISLDDKYFRNRKDIDILKVGKNKFRYTIGYSNKYKKMTKLLKKVRNDFPDAFIIKAKPDDVIYN